MRNTQVFDYSDLKRGFDENVKRNFKDDMEYGIILFPNSDTVKYWFLTHHSAADQTGGTLFEFPKNTLTFVEGYFCCEVQFPNEGKFENGTSFLKEMRKVDGIKP